MARATYLPTSLLSENAEGLAQSPGMASAIPLYAKSMRPEGNLGMVI